MVETLLEHQLAPPYSAHAVRSPLGQLRPISTTSQLSQSRPTLSHREHGSLFLSLRESMISWLPSPFPSRLHACSPQPTITTPVPSLPIHKSYKSSSDTLSHREQGRFFLLLRVFISSLPRLHSPSPTQQHPLFLLPQSSSPNSQNLNPLPPITTAGPHFSGLYNK